MLLSELSRAPQGTTTLLSTPLRKALAWAVSLGLGKVFRKAEEAGLDKIVCSCNGCYAGLKAASQGRAEVLTLAELLLLALD